MKNGPLLDFPADKGDATLGVLLLYENAAAGQGAIRLLDRLHEQVGEGTALHPLLWRFDLLEDPEKRALAQADAAEADLIVIACSNGELPVTVKSWLALWGVNSIPGEAALVALLASDRSHAERESPAYRFLQTTAKKAGQAFFAQESRAAWPDSDSNLEGIHRRAEITSSVLLGILERHPPSSRWGLNE